MRGLTPVIAIILLLLMAVAAAGGFYLVYQNFASSGEESGSSQIQALGETSLSQLTIESVAAGKVYVRNVGASTIDGSKLTVYVDNVPYPVNVSASTISENGRATLKFTSVPACSQPKCEVRVSGAATAARSVEAAKLSCSAGGCAHGESCVGGVCVTTEAVDTDCGNGVCDDGEYGYTCFADCHPESLLLARRNSSDKDTHLAQYDWNGSSYAWESNITTTDMHEWDFVHHLFHQDGSASAVFKYNMKNNMGGNNDFIGRSMYGSSWSYPVNLTPDLRSKGVQIAPPHDVSNSGNEMLTWGVSGSSNNDRRIGWSEVVNGEASPAGMLNDGMNAGWNGGAFSYSQGDNGFLFFSNETYSGVNSWNLQMMYYSWNGNGWGPQTVFREFNNESIQDISIDFSSDGSGMMTWGARDNNPSPNVYYMKYATYDGSSWTYQGNLENQIWSNNRYMLSLGTFYDHNDVPMISVMEVVNEASFDSKYSRYVNGGWTAIQNTMADPPLYVLPMHASDGTLFGLTIGLEAMSSNSQLNFRWTVWDGDSWSEEAEMDHSAD